MTNPLSALSQVVNNSPQVSSLASGQMAALQEAKFQAQMEASQRHQTLVAKTVVPTEKSDTVKADDPNRPNERRSKREARRRRAEPKESMTCQQRENEVASTLLSASSVIDICV